MFWPTMMHAQQDQLEERLADPLDEREWVACLERRGQGDEGQDGEGVGAPHRPDGARDEGGNRAVEPDLRIGLGSFLPLGDVGWGLRTNAADMLGLLGAVGRSSGRRRASLIIGG
jgi:hypothetical protein